MEKLRFTKKKVSEYTGKRHQFIWEHVKSYEEVVDVEDMIGGPYIKQGYLKVNLDLGFEVTNYILLDEYYYEVWNDSDKEWEKHDPLQKILDDIERAKTHCISISDGAHCIYKGLTLEEIDDFYEDMQLKKIKKNIFKSKETGEIFGFSHDHDVYWKYVPKEERLEELIKVWEEERKAADVPEPKTEYISKKKRAEMEQQDQ